MGAVASDGLTVVVSPLLSLIEDQVSQLQALKIRAEQLDSGVQFEQSRDIFSAVATGQVGLAPATLSLCD